MRCPFTLQSNDLKVHDTASLNLIGRRRPLADELGVVLLVPVFPRPRLGNSNLYTHALSRAALQTTKGSLARVDLQLIQMIDDFREMCQRGGISVAPKVLLNGFSASGNFVNRFTAIHPGRVQAAASGGLTVAIMPTDTLDGERLIFPIGIADLQEITGVPFNLGQYRAVPQFIYRGSVDDNDDLPYGDSFGDEERRIITKVLGLNILGRLQTSQNVYRQQGCSAVTFHTYPGVGYSYSPEIIRDILAFFRSNM